MIILTVYENATSESGITVRMHRLSSATNPNSLK